MMRTYCVSCSTLDGKHLWSLTQEAANPFQALGRSVFSYDMAPVFQADNSENLQHHSSLVMTMNGLRWEVEPC